MPVRKPTMKFDSINNTLPLSGITVLAVEQYGAGPFGTSYLADLGANVIKIENHKDGGDVGRTVGPHFFSAHDSHFFQTFNRNKKSITLDLKHPEGIKVFFELVKTADAVLDNLRGDLPEKLKLTYEDLKSINPKIVCTHLSAYGRDGPRKSWPGYDYLMQAEAGHMSLTGEPDGPPVRYGLSIVDLMTGLSAAFGLLSGVIGARQTGKGMDVDLSLFDVALHNLNYPGTWYLNKSVNTGRTTRSSHPSLTPSQLYRTKDGWIFLMCNKEKFWGVLSDALGHSEWRDDPRFIDFPSRLKNRDLVTEMLDQVLMKKTTQQWMDIFGGTVPASPVNDIASALDSEFIQDRECLADFLYPDGQKAKMIRSPIRLKGQDLPLKAAPKMGENTQEILSQSGFSQDQIEKLRSLGVIA
jgi:succinate---hydroxymethylglutarate CoA-transferase